MVTVAEGGNRMEPEIFDLLKEFQDRYPQIEKALDSYRLSIDAYERAMTSLESMTFHPLPTYALTTEVRYNANVSKPD
jgi:hypothetical protein